MTIVASAMVNLKYKNVCVNDIIVQAPEKTSTGYCSAIEYQGEPLSFQTPKLEILSKDTARFNMVKDPLFCSFLEDLQDFLVTTLAKNSVSFFKGKKFSEEKIGESLEINSIGGEGEVYLKNLDLGECSFFDILQDETSAPIKFPYSGHCVIQIPCLKYAKSRVVPEMNVLRIKIGKEVRAKPDSCVLLDEIEDLEDLEEPEINEEDNLDFFGDDDE